MTRRLTEAERREQAQKHAAAAYVALAKARPVTLPFYRRPTANT